MSYVSKRFRTFRKPITRPRPRLNITTPPANPALLAERVLAVLKEYEARNGRGWRAT